jgi:hypothetical protein
MAAPAYANRLLGEKSPYLLQHAHNPVDWYPWGKEAFEKAQAESKLVFLSIGYSTCHWCHVMERESFEDEETAAVINSTCVPIKVDREERPDLDQVYMTVCQALTGSGGWPLNVLLTPEGTPFFAGTYYPRESGHGRVGLKDLLRQAAALWRDDPERVRASGRDIVAGLARPPSGGRTEALDERTFAAAVDLFRRDFDALRGGFGPAPKFPTPHNLTFLLRRFRRTGDREILRMVEATLGAMARGGLFDHVGFGFHRYSTDADWLLPHFEKMLYDQAGLALAYLEAFQATRTPLWGEVARKTLTYLLRDMTGPEGGFYSGEDADSEGVEGKFYVWTREEILGALGPEEGDLFCRVYGALAQGNYREEATGGKSGSNILHLSRPLDETAQAEGIPEGTLTERLEACRSVLFARRESRVRPGRDDKVLTAWNGLMISALARASSILDEPAYVEAAARAADFLLTALRHEGRLLRRYREGEAAIPAFAEDYAFLGRGLLDLYAATFAPERLRQSVDLARELIRLFWDETGEGLFDTASDAEELVMRPKEAYDGATPSANSVALELFSRLFLLTGDLSWKERAQAIVDAFAPRVLRYPAAFTQFLQSAAYLLEPTREVVVAGDPAREDTQALLGALRRSYAPETAGLFVPQGPGSEGIGALAPFASSMKPMEGKAAAYVCEGFTCRQPTTDPQELRRRLAEPPRDL